VGSVAFPPLPAGRGFRRAEDLTGAQQGAGGVLAGRRSNRCSRCGRGPGSLLAARGLGGENRELRPWRIVMRTLQHQEGRRGRRVQLPPAPQMWMTGAGSGSRRAPWAGARSARQGGAKPVRRLPPALSLRSLLPGPGWKASSFPPLARRWDSELSLPPLGRRCGCWGRGRGEGLGQRRLRSPAAAARRWDRGLGRRRTRGGETRGRRPWAGVTQMPLGRESRRAPANAGGAKPVRPVPAASSLRSVLPGPGRFAAVSIRICCESPDRGGLAVLHSSVLRADPRCPSGRCGCPPWTDSNENRYLPLCQEQVGQGVGAGRSIRLWQAVCGLN
jgi:hypothetical protein